MTEICMTWCPEGLHFWHQTTCHPDFSQNVDALFFEKCSENIFEPLVYIPVILVNLHTYIASIRLLDDNISNSFASNGYSRYNEQDSQVNAGQVFVRILSSNGSHVPPKDNDGCQGIQETVGLKEEDDLQIYNLDIVKIKCYIYQGQPKKKKNRIVFVSLHDFVMDSSRHVKWALSDKRLDINILTAKAAVEALLLKLDKTTPAMQRIIDEMKERREM